MSSSEELSLSLSVLPQKYPSFQEIALEVEVVWERTIPEERFFILKVDLGQGELAFPTPPGDNSTGSSGHRQFVGVDTSLRMGKLGQRSEVTFTQSWSSCLNSWFLGLFLLMVLETKNNVAVQKRELVRTD